MSDQTSSPQYRLLINAVPQWLGNASANKLIQFKCAALTLPTWYSRASHADHSTLKRLNSASWIAQNLVDRALDKVQNINDFARPKLQKAIKEQFALELDVETTLIRLYIPAKIPWFPIRSGAARTWTVSLLEAALHNFELDETSDDAHERASSYLRKTPTLEPQEPSTCEQQKTPPPDQFEILADVKERMSIQDFTRLCRTLDIGGQYQAYLAENFLEPVASAVLQLQVNAAQKAMLTAALHTAVMKQDLDSTLQSLIEGIVDGLQGMRLDGKPWQAHDLTMMSAQLTGIVVFAPDLERYLLTVPVVAYIPDDPESPIKQYASSAAFMLDLTQKLRGRPYQEFFSRFVAHEDRAYFFADLHQRLSRVTWHQHVATDPMPTWRETPVSKPNLQFAVKKINDDVLTHLYQQKLNKIINDAAVIAVSTASADRKARWQRWDALQKIATTLLEIAAFVAAPFFPPLGALMIGYTLYQVLDETFESIIDWAEGRTNEALNHFMTLLETLVQLGMFAVGAPIAEHVLRKVLPQELWDFIDGLKPVQLPDGQPRLWHPDLKPYARKTPLPAASIADEQGVHHHLDQAVVPIGNTPYSLNRLPGEDAFSITHPSRPHAYQPKVWHNGSGAWYSELDEPLYWDNSTLLRRLGHPAEPFSTAELEHIQRVSDIDESTLRRVHAQHQPTPPALADTLKRFKIERDINTFIRQMSSDDPAQYRQASTMTQLQLLCTPEVWPQTRTLRVVDSQGKTLWRYAPTPRAPQVVINQGQLKNGDLLNTILQALNENEIKTLLGEEFGLPPRALEVRTRTLRQQLAKAAQTQKNSVFESHYRAVNRPAIAQAQHLMDNAPGLPATMADILTSQATPAERLELNTGRVPKRLQDLARWARQETRLNRAYEGLYLNAPENPDSHTLALHSLPRLPGWSGKVRLEVREHTVEGPLRDSIGTTPDTARKVLVHEEGQYQAYDGDGQHLQGGTDFYNAVLQALPDSERNSLNLHIRQGTQLREGIAKVVLPRDRLLPLLEKRPVRPPAAKTIQRLLGGKNGYPAPAHPTPIPGTPRSLEQRAQELYPSHSAEQIRERVRELNRQPGGARAGLLQLEAEYGQLSQDLSTWVAETPRLHPQTQAPLPLAVQAYEQQKRGAFADEIQRCWRRETERSELEEDAGNDYSLIYEEPLLGQLPTLTARFDHVASLSLVGDEDSMGAHAFIRHFPQVRQLELRNFPLDTLPDGLSDIPRLTDLILDSCSIRLTPQSHTLLASMSRLVSLDLYRNPLGITPDVTAMAQLKHLDLSSTGIDQLPAGLLTRPQLESANLSNNRIPALHDAFFDLPEEVSAGFDLAENPFPEATIERVKMHFQQTGERWEVSAPQVDIERLKLLYPTFSTNDCDLYYFGMPGDLRLTRVELTRLEAEYEKLTADLEEWRIDVPTQHPTLDVELSEDRRAREQVKRSRLKERLEACWRRETTIDTLNNSPHITHELMFEDTLLGDLPTLSANFDHVSLLALVGEGATSDISRFLDAFPKLRSLSIQGYRLQQIPRQVFQMPLLQELVLPQCDIQLTPVGAEELGGLNLLTYLDLSDNLLGTTPRVGNMQHLIVLDLQNTGIREIPPGLLSLRRLSDADLRDNAIRNIGSELLEVPTDIFIALQLDGNPLSNHARRVMSRYRQRARTTARRES